MDECTEIETNLEIIMHKLHFFVKAMWNLCLAGSIIGLTCIPITKCQSSAKELEFPLFLNALAAVPIKIAVEKGGLPHGISSCSN